MKTKIIFVLVSVLFVFMSVAYAHSGRTDSSGGHYNRQTGTYHYHHGYSAHDHENGICPYDFDDKTNHSSGSNSVKDSGYITTPIPTATPAPTISPTPTITPAATVAEQSGLTSEHYISFCVIAFLAIGIWCFCITRKRKERALHLIHNAAVLFSECIDAISGIQYAEKLPTNAVIENGYICSLNDTVYFMTPGRTVYHAKMGCSTAYKAISSTDKRLKHFSPCKKCFKNIPGIIPFNTHTVFINIRNTYSMLCDDFEELEKIIVKNRLLFRMSLDEVFDMKFKIKTERESIKKALERLETEYFGKMSAISLYAAENLNKEKIPARALDLNTGATSVIYIERKKLPVDFMKKVGTDGVVYISHKNGDNIYVLTYEEYKNLNERMVF